jgi:hypothetical protein
MAAPSSSMFNFGGSGATIRPESPLRAVKKMRGAAGEQVVRDWDVRGSPPRNRRIVTRSTQGEAEEDLLELGEEDAEDVGLAGATSPREDIVRVEIEHEDGTIVELDPEEGEAEAENENWDDESMTDEVVYDATLMHLAETIGESAGAVGIEQQADGLHVPHQDMDTDDIPTTDEPNGGHANRHEDVDIAEPVDVTKLPQVDTTSAEQLSAEGAPHVLESPAKQPREAPPIPQLKSALKQRSQFGAIPEGFVSPVKERQRRTINQVRLSNANRRRTLPVNFAAQHPASLQASAEVQIDEEAPIDESASIKTAEDNHSQTIEQAGEVLVVPSESVSEATLRASLVDDESEIELGILPSDSEVLHVEEHPVDETHNENAWEDVDEEVPDDDTNDEMEEEATHKQLETETSPEILPSHEEQVQNGEEMVILEDAELKSPTKLDSSPVGTIAGPHPRLPLRRSPRRQSTSPVRRSGILPSSSRSHLIAFTPIKLPVYSSASEVQGSPLSVNVANDDMDVDDDRPAQLPQPTGSSSAPSEEPQMSPRRPKQPRVSDDTAYLTEFIKRNAESKTSRDGRNVAKRESMENRKDSDTVRQALASPAPSTVTVAGDVLADLDPNSPSPRKQALAASLAEVAQSNGKAAVDQDEDELALNATPTKRTSSRVSGRVKKRSQVLPSTTYAGPNRIAIRSADSVVVLKKTEAQEIAQMTKNNTRKNKSGAVAPRTRLSKLKEKLNNADENAPPDDDPTDVTVPAEKSGRRAVKWAETLETFHEGANEPEMSMLSDELNETADPPQSESDMPPASDTPSKPSRLRRLRTPRPTASSSGTTRAATAEAAASAAPIPTDDDTKPPKVKKRSSRIATPAKLPGSNKLLLPDGLMDVDDAGSAAPPSTTKKTPIPRKKAPSSKLPAPSSLSAAAGKENSLIASPPKKRTTSRSAGATSNVPNLDFAGSKAVLEPVVGLGASPAKKGAARAQVLFKENGDVSVSRNEAPALGMGSPAKKRTRRVL